MTSLVCSRLYPHRMLPNEIDDHDSNDFFDVDEEEEDEEQVNGDLLIICFFDNEYHMFLKRKFKHMFTCLLLLIVKNKAHLNVYAVFSNLFCFVALLMAFGNNLEFRGTTRQGITSLMIHTTVVQYFVFSVKAFRLI